MNEVDALIILALILAYMFGETAAVYLNYRELKRELEELLEIHKNEKK